MDPRLTRNVKAFIKDFEQILSQTSDLNNVIIEDWFSGNVNNIRVITLHLARDKQGAVLEFTGQDEETLRWYLDLDQDQRNQFLQQSLARLRSTEFT